MTAYIIVLLAMCVTAAILVVAVKVSVRIESRHQERAFDGIWQ